MDCLDLLHISPGPQFWRAEYTQIPQSFGSRHTPNLMWSTMDSDVRIAVHFGSCDRNNSTSRSQKIFPIFQNSVPGM